MNRRVYCITEEQTDGCTYHFNERHLFTLNDGVTIDDFQCKFMDLVFKHKEEKSLNEKNRKKILDEMRQISPKLESNNHKYEERYDKLLAKFSNYKTVENPDLDKLITESGGTPYNPEETFRIDGNLNFLN